MGQLLLLVVAAAWAAVLLPPLLRSRVENRPNSSVSDFRNQLNRLQRAVPGRGVAVRTMGRPLAPSTLTRPAATGRPGQSANARTNGSVSSRIAGQTAPPRRPSRADARQFEATLRPRAHGDATASRGMVRPRDPKADLKRRRANVLFVLVLTAVCAGFLAATTDSKPMVYVFALAMLALGGYVYLLVTISERERFARGYGVEYAADDPAPPLRRQRATRQERTPRVDRDDFDDFDEYAGYDDIALEQAPRQRRVAPPPAVRAQYDAELPAGSGVSGRISYGSRTRAPSRDPFAVPAPRGRDLRDPYGRDGVGWETPSREDTRRAPFRSGRHATGQHSTVRRGQVSRRDPYAATG